MHPITEIGAWILSEKEFLRDYALEYGSWETVYSRFRKWIEDGILDNVLRSLSLDAEPEELSLDGSIVRAHQHSADAYGYPVYLMLSERQRNDIHFATPLLEHTDMAKAV